MPNKLDIVKFAIGMTAKVGVSKVIYDIIDNNTTVETAADSVKVTIGSAVLATIVVDHTLDYLNDKVDSVADLFKKNKSDVEIVTS